MSPPPPRLIQNDLLLQFNCSSTHVCIIVQVVIYFMSSVPQGSNQAGSIKYRVVSHVPKNVSNNSSFFMLYVDPEILL